MLQVDLEDATALLNQPIQGADICYLAPPSPSGETDSCIHACLNKSLLAQNRPRRIVYISTTGVYGDMQGGWVDEQTPTHPSNERSQRRLEAEHYVQTLCNELGIEWVILRVSGIYGPGRWPLDRLKQGMKVIREAEAPWSNRIHVQDLARVCIRAMDHSPSGEIYNVSDGQPSTMSDYYKKVAEAFSLPSPEEIPLNEAENFYSPMMMSFLCESKRINNKKMKTMLEMDLSFPTLESALKSVSGATQN